MPMSTPYIICSASAVSSIGVLPARSPMPSTVVCEHLHPFGQRHDGVRHPHAEVHVEVRLQPLGDPRLHLADEVLHGVRRQHAEGIHQRQRVHVPLVRHALDQVEHPADVGAGEVDGEEHDFEALAVRIRGGLRSKVSIAFSSGHWYAILDDVLAGRDLHDDALDARIGRTLHVLHHAAGEGEDLRPEVAPHDLADRRVIGRARRSASPPRCGARRLRQAPPRCGSSRLS